MYTQYVINVLQPRKLAAMLETITQINLAEILKAHHNSIRIDIVRHTFKEKTVEDVKKEETKLVLIRYACAYYSTVVRLKKMLIIAFIKSSNIHTHTHRIKVQKYKTVE